MHRPGQPQPDDGDVARPAHGEEGKAIARGERRRWLDDGSQRGLRLEQEPAPTGLDAEQFGVSARTDVDRIPRSRRVDRRLDAGKGGGGTLLLVIIDLHGGHLGALGRWAQHGSHDAK
jgi:hypothetical protein